MQQIGIERRLTAGERLVGRKVGLTSQAMQRQLGVDRPDFGAITDAMVVPNGGTLDPAALIAPRLEPEYAFRIGEDLPPSPSYGEVRASIDAVALSIEVIDSRVSEWDIGLVDTIADNASSARIAVGQWRTASPELLDAIVDGDISLLRDGVEVASGPGSAVLGDPIAAIHWLATAIGEFGQSLERGSTVLAGAVCAAVPLDPGTPGNADPRASLPCRWWRCERARGVGRRRIGRAAARQGGGHRIGQYRHRPDGQGDARCDRLEFAILVGIDPESMGSPGRATSASRPRTRASTG